MSENVRRSRVKAFRYAAASSLRKRFESANLLVVAQKVFLNVRLHVRKPSHACPEMVSGRNVQVFCDPEGGGSVVDGMQVVGRVDVEDMELLKPFTDAAMGVLDARVEEVSEFDGSFHVVPIMDQKDEGDERRT